ncbi:MAG: hypothetical protein Q7J48_00885 [Nocardioides sp.]|nr:hypothetical protein [Nocardioides sp.]
MHTRPRLAAMAAALPLLIPIAVAAPAHAEVRTITDATGDGSDGTGSSGPRKWGDIGTVRVNHAPKRVYFRVFAAPGGQLPDFYDLWVDTNKSNPGPEFVVTYSLETERIGVSSTDRFLEFGPATCSLDTDTIIRQGVRLVVPRTCLRTEGFKVPWRIRTSVQTSMEYENADWAPGRKRFGPWVKVG